MFKRVSDNGIVSDELHGVTFAIKSLDNTENSNNDFQIFDNNSVKLMPSCGLMETILYCLASDSASVW